MEKNTETITREFCQGKNLIFQPKTVEEAVFIQRKIFEMGYRWYWSRSNRVDNIEQSLNAGIELRHGQLFTGGYSAPKDGILCTVHQFNEPFDPKDIKNLYVPPNQEFILELFNRMAEKIDSLEDEVKQLRKEVGPKEPPKPKWGT